MVISEIDQEVSDFNWFAVDCNGYLIHFASIGNRLPPSVSASKENLELLESYFMSLPILFTEVDIFPHLATAAVSYSQLYLEYACRGLFSYEAIIPAGPMGTTHKLVARPPHTLTLADLPDEIAKIISKTQLGISIAGLASFDTKAVA
jgi:hypothetical protein